MSHKECKDRYFKKAYKNAKNIKCACGCGGTLKDTDKYARPKKFINGHNTRKYHGEDASRWSAEKRWRVKNPDKVRNRKREFYRSRKIKAMELCGNQCSKCWLKYNGKNSPAFEFHHTNPATKESGISRMLVNKAWEDTVKELKQCVMICANCHNLEHGGEW